MKEALREQQKRLARTRITDAAAAELVEKGIGAFAVPAVAERAGVSLRTVYNYYENRDALLDGVVAAADDRMTELGGISELENLDHLTSAFRTNWDVFSKLGVIGEAATLVRLDRAARRGERSMRTSNSGVLPALRRHLQAASPDLDPVTRDVLAAVIRHLISFDSWHRLTTEFDLETEDSADVVAWMIELVGDGVREGRHPTGGDARSRMASPPTVN